MKQCRFCNNEVPFYGSDTCEACKLEADARYLREARLRAPAAIECRSGRTPREALPKPLQPPIAGEADPEYQTRIHADQTTAEFGARSARPLDGGRKPITDSPLFGGPAQGNLFGGDE